MPSRENWPESFTIYKSCLDLVKRTISLSQQHIVSVPYLHHSFYSVSNLQAFSAVLPSGNCKALSKISLGETLLNPHYWPSPLVFFTYDSFFVGVTITSVHSYKVWPLSQYIQLDLAHNSCSINVYWMKKQEKVTSVGLSKHHTGERVQQVEHKRTIFSCLFTHCHLHQALSWDSVLTAILWSLLDLCFFLFDKRERKLGRETKERVRERETTTAEGTQ